MTQPEPAPQPDQEAFRSVKVDAQRVIERLGARIGALEAEKAQLEDVIRQLVSGTGEVPQPAGP
jgi:prefoldin subunit 5